MILNGECGAFNPMLLDCLQEISMRLRSALPTLAADQVLRRDAKRLSAELLQKSAVPHSDRAQRELNYVKEKLDFFVSCCGDVQFEYDVPAGTIIIADRSRPRQQRARYWTSGNGQSPTAATGRYCAAQSRSQGHNAREQRAFAQPASAGRAPSSTGTTSGCTRSGRRSPPVTMSA